MLFSLEYKSLGITVPLSQSMRLLVLSTSSGHDQAVNACQLFSISDKINDKILPQRGLILFATHPIVIDRSCQNQLA